MRMRVFIAALMSALFICAYAQDTIVYTPIGSPVLDSWRELEGSPTELDSLDRKFLDTYSGYDSITAWSSRTYNCRGYAWHMTYNNKLNDPVIIENRNQGESIYWSDGSYVEVPFAFATRVVYSHPEHTAYVVSNADSICESKWGYQPRFTHKLTWLPDGVTEWICYSRPIEIIGDANYYTVRSIEQRHDVSKDTDFLWSVGPFLEIVSGQDSSHCSIRKRYFPGCQDTSWISVRLVRYGDTLNIVSSVSIVNGEIPSISGPSTLCASGGSYSISNLPTGATISWNCSSNITRQSAQGSNPCTFKANTNGTGTITATITYQGNTYTLQKGGISVGLRATASGPSYIAPMNNGTWTAYPSCGNTPYQYAWYLKKRGTVGGPTLVGTRSSLRLMSIPANLRESGPTWEAEGDTTRGGISRVYYDLYVTVRDSHGAEYTPPTMSVSTEKNYIISLGYKKGDYEDDAFDDSTGDTEPTLTLSPNPAGEYVDIRIDFGDADNEPSSYVMEILNTSSYPVRNAVLSGVYNRVNVQGLQRGYYVVRIRYGDTVLTKPLMVE